VDRASLEGRWLTWLRAPLRDPFLLQPPPPPKAVVVVTPASQLKLSGLWVQTGSRLAVINGGVYGEEDVVMGFRILRIDKDQVQVARPGEDRIYQFHHLRGRRRVRRQGHELGAVPAWPGEGNAPLLNPARPPPRALTSNFP
jgi:hypothetical protein